MGWVIFIVVVITAWIMSSKEINNKTRTEDGYPKIDLTIVKCDSVPQGIEAVLSCNKDELTINANGFVKVVQNEDIIDVTVESAKSIANNPQFSFGKAIVGVTLLGGVGAVAGLTGKNKDNDLQMLVISYMKNDTIEHMVFLQQYGKDYTVKTESNLLNKVKNDILEVISGKYDTGKLESK